jgi:hypothetical protein
VRKVAQRQYLTPRRRDRSLVLTDNGDIPIEVDMGDIRLLEHQVDEVAYLSPSQGLPRVDREHWPVRLPRMRSWREGDWPVDHLLSPSAVAHDVKASTIIAKV